MTSQAPSYRVRVTDGKQRRSQSISCVLGDHVKLDCEQLQNSFNNPMQPEDVDLLTVLGAVAFSDRIARRKRSIGWHRNISVTVPVSQPDRWNESTVVNSLLACLQMGTGDNWNFCFAPGKARRPLPPLIGNVPSANIEAVFPFSGGIDSYAGYLLWKHKNPNAQALFVGTEPNRAIASLICNVLGQSSHWRVQLPLRMKIGNHAEPTYRTRAFVFFTVAALAARLANAPTVLVPENGQGALGPLLVPVGDEHPYCTAQPGFTSLIQDFLSTLWGHNCPRFCHPHVWETKGEMMKRASQACQQVDWTSTQSCSRNPRRYKGSMSPGACGICGGCLLRRVSFYTAGLQGIQEEYLWNDLSGSNFEQGYLPQVEKRPTDNDKDIAYCAVSNHRSLAAAARYSDSHPSIKRVSSLLSNSMRISPDVSRGRLRLLLKNHADQWCALLDYLGPRSWVTKLGRVS